MSTYNGCPKDLGFLGKAGVRGPTATLKTAGKAPPDYLEAAEVDLNFWVVFTD